MNIVMNGDNSTFGPHLPSLQKVALVNTPR
jgi:hypothetical protein